MWPMVTLTESLGVGCYALFSVLVGGGQEIQCLLWYNNFNNFVYNKQIKTASMEGHRINLQWLVEGVFFASNTDDTEECINFWKTGGYSARIFCNR